MKSQGPDYTERLKRTMSISSSALYSSSMAVCQRFLVEKGLALLNDEKP